jgi:hypothetical protein
MTSKPAWFEKHATPIRRSAWAGPAPLGLYVVPSGDPAHDSETARPGGGAEAPAAVLVPGEALDASEQMLAVRTAELAGAHAELLALRQEIVTAHAATTDAQDALLRFTEKTLEDAESELVKLAVAIAERVVGRELATAPDLIVGWAREALATSSLGEGLVVAVSSDVASALEPLQWKDLAPRLVTDAALPPSTCELRDGQTTVIVGGGDRLDLVTEQLARIPARAA